MSLKHESCRQCGERIRWSARQAINAQDLKPHRCATKVKIYTKDEIAEMNRKLRGQSERRAE